MPYWTEQRNRHRLLSICLLAITIALGLGSRHFKELLPWWLAKNAGDILYATMVYWLVGFLFPKVSLLRCAIAATIFCFVIEFTQLYQADWINTIRHTRPGALVLGSGFHATDLLCYLIGVGIGAAFEVSIIFKSKEKI